MRECRSIQLEMQIVYQQSTAILDSGDSPRCSFVDLLLQRRLGENRRAGKGRVNISRVTMLELILQATLGWGGTVFCPALE
jgi:hypothetical protein